MNEWIEKYGRLYELFYIWWAFAIHTPVLTNSCIHLHLWYIVRTDKVHTNYFISNHSWGKIWKKREKVMTNIVIYIINQIHGRLGLIKWV